jgi:hypothetical protein
MPMAFTPVTPQEMYTPKITHKKTLWRTAMAISHWMQTHERYETRWLRLMETFSWIWNMMPCTCRQTDDQITCYLSSLACYIAAVGNAYWQLGSLHNSYLCLCLEYFHTFSQCGCMFPSKVGTNLPKYIIYNDIPEDSIHQLEISQCENLKLHKARTWNFNYLWAEQQPQSENLVSIQTQYLQNAK